MAPKTTMLDLVTALSRSVRTDAEVVADVAFLVNTGRVLLCGSFKGARIDLALVDPTIECPAAA